MNENKFNSQKFSWGHFSFFLIIEFHSGSIVKVDQMENTWWHNRSVSFKSCLRNLFNIPLTFVLCWITQLTHTLVVLLKAMLVKVTKYPRMAWIKKNLLPHFITKWKTITHSKLHQNLIFRRNFSSSRDKMVFKLR